MATPVIQPETWNIILPAEKPNIPEYIRQEARAYELKEKDEHHISILVAANAKVVKDALEKSDNVHAAHEEIQNLVRSFSWSYDLTNEYYLHERTYTEDELRRNGYTDLTEHTRRTIVQRADLPDMQTFYEKIENFLDVSLPLPVPHITLFRRSDYGDYPGIGINSNVNLPSVVYTYHSDRG